MEFLQTIRKGLDKILCAPVNTATFKSMTGRIAHTDEIPSAIAIGTPATNIIISRTKMISPEIIAILIFFLLSSFPRDQDLCHVQDQ